jgi:hypothetical protein
MESTRVHQGVDRLDADGTRVSGQESTIPAIPRREKIPHPGPGAAAGAARSSSCARHCRITRRTPITGIGSGKMPETRGKMRGPLPVMRSLRAPDLDLWRCGARFPKESRAGALEIYLSTKKKNLRVRRRARFQATTGPLTASLQSNSPLGEHRHQRQYPPLPLVSERD